MKSKRIRRFGIAALFWTVLLFTAAAWYSAAVSGGEEVDPPDLNQIESPYLLEDNRALFPCEDGSYVAVSTEGTKRMYVVKLWRTTAGWEVRLSAALRPGFRKVFCVDQDLYFLMDVTDVIEEGSGTDAPAIQIIRYHMEDEQTEARIIRNAVCDYDRTCRVESGGRILLVHAPLLDEISDLTPVRVYQFDSAEYVLLPQEEFPQESEEGESSQPSESGTSSEERPEQTLLYLFDGPITVSELEESYTEHTGVVRVTGTDGRIKTSGRVATGDLMEVLIDGQVSDRAVACIPGDITGRGKPSSADTQLLYEYLTTGCYLSDAEWKAGDLNCDGILSTGDLLLLKEMVWKQG